MEHTEATGPGGEPRHTKHGRPSEWWAWRIRTDVRLEAVERRNPSAKKLGSIVTLATTLALIVLEVLRHLLK